MHSRSVVVDFIGCAKVDARSETNVESLGDRVALPLGERAQAGSLVQILAEQALVFSLVARSQI